MAFINEADYFRMLDKNFEDVLELLLKIAAISCTSNKSIRIAFIDDFTFQKVRNVSSIDSLSKLIYNTGFSCSCGACQHGAFNAPSCKSHLDTHDGIISANNMLRMLFNPGVDIQHLRHFFKIFDSRRLVHSLECLDNFVS